MSFVLAGVLRRLRVENLVPIRQTDLSHGPGLPLS